jgi:dTDP-4-dehydrorhamnose 3,5-epimerase
MIFRVTQLDQVRLLVIERHVDERGSFGRTFCKREFATNGLAGEFVQSSTSFSRRAGTVRGMHYQRPPDAEAKLVRCIRGSIYDVVVDVRPASPSFMRWQGFTLAGTADEQLYIPPGCAHGFQTLEDDTEVLYHMSCEYAPQSADGFRYDDPAFAIVWPREVTAIAGKDLAWPPVTVRPEGASGGYA